MIKKKNIEELFNTFIQLETNPIDFMRNTTFRRSELKLDPRVANHWVEKELFPRTFETGTWLIFNLSEAFWVKIIMKLREFNVSLEVIKKIKEGFFNDPKLIITDAMKDLVMIQLKESGILSDEQINLAKNEDFWNEQKKLKLNDFEIILQSILLERKPYFILIDKNGESLLTNETDLLLETNEVYLKEYREMTSKSHIRISMNEILGDLVDTLGELVCSETIPILTKNEATIIKLIRSENVSKIEIRYRNSKEPDTVEITSSNMIQEKARLNELIVSKGYQNITVKTQNGQIVYCENTLKYKLDTE